MSNAVKVGSRPKMILFRPVRANLPKFVQEHFVDQAECLRLSFDLYIVDDPDCDLDVLCDLHEPDLLMFESGVYAPERKIRNALRHLQIPRIGFCNSDAYCTTRSIFLADMDAWGVQTYFTHATAMGSYIPEIRDKLYLWPNFINPRRLPIDPIERNLIVLLTGSRVSHYPWRRKISRILAERYSAKSTPHFGWFDAASTQSMVSGDAYMKLLASAQFVPTCGSVAQEIVRKHFEIPASGACLITERTPVIEAAGFEDMVNCVFATGADVLDKVEFLLSSPETLRRIANAGRDLVLGRHTLEHRQQIYHWFRAVHSCSTGTRIIQESAFHNPVSISSKDWYALPLYSEGSIHKQLLTQAFRHLADGNTVEARESFLRCLNFHSLPEATRGVALTYLQEGRPLLAQAWLLKSLETAIGQHFASTPDPVEWAMLLRILLCSGRLGDAIRCAKLVDTVRHLELDRMRLVVHALAHERLPNLPSGTERPSVHVVPPKPIDVWIQSLAMDLRTCGQTRMAIKDLASPHVHSCLTSPMSDFNGENINADRDMLLDEIRRQRSRVRIAERIEGLNVPVRRSVIAIVAYRFRIWLGWRQAFADHVANLAARENYKCMIMLGVSLASVWFDFLSRSMSGNPYVSYGEPIRRSLADLPPAGDLMLVIGHRNRKSPIGAHILRRSEVIVLLDLDCDALELYRHEIEEFRGFVLQAKSTTGSSCTATYLRSAINQTLTRH